MNWRTAIYGGGMGIALGICGIGVSDWRFWILIVASALLHTFTGEPKK